MTDDNIESLWLNVMRSSADNAPPIRFARAIEAAAVAQDRERCIQALLAVRDKSGVNSDGGSWLMRATRQDYVDALVALTPNAGVEPHSTAAEELGWAALVRAQSAEIVRLRKDSELLAWVVEHPETCAECLQDAAAGDGTARDNLAIRRAGLRPNKKGTLLA